MGIFKRSSSGGGLARANGGRGAPEDNGGEPQDVAVLRAILRHYAPGHRLRMGERTRCPKCGQEGLFNPSGRSSSPAHRCGTCEISWHVTERALEILRSEADLGDAELDRVRGRLAGHRAMQLLLVEDDPKDAKMLRRIFDPVVPDVVEIFHTDNLHDGMLNARLGFDATLIDVNLPDSTGMDTVRRFRQECEGLAVCFATGDPGLADELRDSGIAVMPKYDLERYVRRHHHGTAEVLDMIVDVIAATPRPTRSS